MRVTDIQACGDAESRRTARPAHTVTRHFSCPKPSINASTAVGDGIWMDAGLESGGCRVAGPFRHHVPALKPPWDTLAELVCRRRLLLRSVPADRKPLLTARMADPQPAYDDPHTPLHPKVPPLQSVLKKLVEREKKIPKSSIPLTKRNLEEFHNPDYTDVHNAFLTVRPGRKVSVHEWLQLLP